MKQTIIRIATVADASAILEIYGYYVANTAISMEYEIPTLENFQTRIANTIENNYPYLVAEQDGKIVGYAYAGRFHPRAAFYRSAEVSIYIHKDAQFNNCCTKFGRWYHLIWMEKFLGKHK